MKPGTKLDAGKPRMSLFPAGALRAIVAVLEYGAVKYSPGGWRLVTEANVRYYDALQRHLDAWRLGERFDAESGLLHLAHAACCAVFLLGLELDAQATPVGAGEAIGSKAVGSSDPAEKRSPAVRARGDRP